MKSPFSLASIKGWLGTPPFSDLLLGEQRSPVIWTGRLPKWVRNSGLGLLCLSLLAGVTIYEMMSSALQSWLFHSYASRLTYQVAPGPSSAIVFPEAGPFNQRLGYSDIPKFQNRLEQRGFEVRRQAQFSGPLKGLAEARVSPPYRIPTAAGLVIYAGDGDIMYDARPREFSYSAYEEVPPLLVSSLLFVEDSGIADYFDPRNNPVIDWQRLFKASFLYGGNKIGFPFRVEGASTLATQIEKYQNSPGGQTVTPADKLRQMLGATLKVYREDRDTRLQREMIILEYLNTVPLAAFPQYGEVTGIGEGLYAWFDLTLDQVNSMLAQESSTSTKAQAFKSVLALVSSARAPSFYLMQDRTALENRVRYFTNAMARARLIPPDFAVLVNDTPLPFREQPPQFPVPPFERRKAGNLVRADLVRALGLNGYYELDRLHLEVQTTIDTTLQREVLQLLRNLRDPEFVASKGLNQGRLLAQGSPEEVLYSLMLFEKSSLGNSLLVHIDSLDQPFDLNSGMKLELGSTAKLRTLAHYLEVVEGLYEEIRSIPEEDRIQLATKRNDPISRWALGVLGGNRGILLEDFLDQALDRKYSASPGEVFFTGGGRHTFRNFDVNENHQVISVREAMIRSTNLVFVRLMRDLMRFHMTRLSYDPEELLKDPDHPERKRLLEEIAEAESQSALFRFFKKYSDAEAAEIERRLLGKRYSSARHQAMLYYAWHPSPSQEGLAEWLHPRIGALSSQELQRLVRAYGNPSLNISDFGYLLNRHPLEVWIAGHLVREPGNGRNEILEHSQEARRISSRWLFRTRNRSAQELRLRIRFEEDAFERMTPYWRRLGFPFERLVPSLATSLGNSSDRPAALAELMGIILNDGMHLNPVAIRQLHLGRGTPYETLLEPRRQDGERVMSASVARTLRGVLGLAVTEGTGRRLAGTFKTADGRPLPAGGKTGSGDNRIVTVGRSGQTISSQPLNRTATFVFYLGDKHFGVVTAFVPGSQSEDYRFTSALPVSILNLLAPTLESRILATQEPVDIEPVSG